MMNNHQYRIFLEGELNWVELNHPSLLVCEEGTMLRGPLKFFAKYEDFNKNFLELEDEYNVNIRIGWDHMPHVWETGGRLQTRADNLGKQLIDMHVYPNTKEICMATVPMIKAIYADDPTIKGIFYNLIIRYFYYHTYWEQQGVEPWKGLRHDDAGIIDDYFDNRGIVCVSEYIKYLSYTSKKRLNSRNIRRTEKKCLCNKYKKKDCRCGIMEKYHIFEKDFLDFKKNYPEKALLLFNQ